MNFIDTHQHLVLRDRLGYTWTKQIEALASGDFTMADYRALSEGSGISGSLYMETSVDEGDWQSEARIVAKLIDDPANLMLGQIASCRPETDQGFGDWLDECATLHVRGFRRVLHVMPDDLSASQVFRANITEMGRRDLTFDLCVLARQLPIAYNLAATCDGTEMVLNHCGVPDIAGGQFASWASGISAFAALDHVVCKLSGITPYCAPDSATLATLSPWVDHIFQVFGPERVLWGADWPVVNLGTGLKEWMALTHSFLRGLSISEQEAVAHGTAERVYGLDTGFANA